MLALRREMGIRLTRRSMRALRSFACRAYWERSLRARSVTADTSALLHPTGLSVPRTLQLKVVDQRLLLAPGQAYPLNRSARRRGIRGTLKFWRLAFQSSHCRGGIGGCKSI